MADTYRLKNNGGGTSPGAGPAPSPVGAGKATPAAGPVRRPPVTEKPPVEPPAPLPGGGRLTSLDAYRGCIMILLAASGFGVARLASLPETAPVWHRPVTKPDGVREATAEDVATRRAWWRTAAFHFDHPAWRSDFLISSVENPRLVSDWKRWGVSLWDLIQPAFMFMVGVAMPFSERRRAAAGDSVWRRRRHVLFRAALLVLLGVFLATGRGTHTNWMFTNVLAQIGLGYAFVYALLGLSRAKQAVACVLILGGYWACLQFVDWRPIAGLDPGQPVDHAALGADADKGEVLTGRFAPWTKNANVAHAVDVRLLNLLADPQSAAMNEWRTKAEAGPLSLWERLQWTVRRTLFANPQGFSFNSGGYQTLNFVPSMVTMLLGVMCGGLLLGPGGSGRKFCLLLAGAAVCLVLGRVTGIYLCPIVKRIWTPSWALFSGGYVIALLAAFYFLFDILPLRRLAFPLTVVGMNSLAMYLMGQLMGPFARERIVRPHLTGLLEAVFRTDRELDGPAYWLSDEMFGRVIEPAAVLLIFWLIVYWMYRQKIFLRL